MLDLTTSNPTTAIATLGTEEAFGMLAAPEVLRYDPDPRGAMKTREAIAGYYADHGADVDPSHIVLTASTSEAYGWIFKLLCDPGDRVVVARPGYPLFDELARLEGVHLDPVALEHSARWSIDLGALREALAPATRAISVVHPNNPTGTFVRQVERDALTSLASEHPLALIVDEVFLDYPWRDGAAHLGSFADTRDALTFTLSGLSKVVGAPQVKLGWIVVSGPPSLRDEALARLELIADCYLSVSAAAQHATPALLSRRHLAQRAVRARVAENLDALARALGDGSAITPGFAEAGWYASLRLPRTRSDEAWSLELLNEGVLTQPGWFYDYSDEAWIVTSLITPPESFLEGVQRLCALVEKG